MLQLYRWIYCVIGENTEPVAIPLPTSLLFLARLSCHGKIVVELLSLLVSETGQTSCSSKKYNYFSWDIQLYTVTSTTIQKYSLG